MIYDQSQRIFLYDLYSKLQNYTKVLRAYAKKYKTRNIPSINTVKAIVNRFKLTGSVNIKTNKKRPNTVRTNELIDQLKNIYLDDPETSLAKASNIVPASRTTIRKVLREDLNLKPFKKKRTFLLKKSDHEKRLNFVDWVNQNEVDVSSDLICSDEAIFYLHGGHNIQNDRIWAEFQPNELVEAPLNDEKVMVWCAFSGTHFFGPHFFEENVNWKNYLDMLKNFFWRRFSRVKGKERFYFQQDGAPPHRKKEVQSWLEERFGKKFIDSKTWPPRSPDLNPCDFSLWGFLKQKVYNPKPNTVFELKENIIREIKEFSKTDFSSIFCDLEKRLALVEEQKGSHIEHLLK